MSAPRSIFAVTAASTGVLAALLSLALLGLAASGAEPPWYLWLLCLVAVVAAFTGLAWLLLGRSSRALALLSGALADAYERRLLPPVEADAPGQVGELVYAYSRAARSVNAAIADLQEEHARLQALFDSVAEPIIGVTATEDVAFLNSAAARLFNIEAERARGKPFLFAANDHELLELVRACKASHAKQTAFLSFGARRVPLQASAVPAAAAGSSWSVLLLLTDLTEVRRLEDMRRDFISNASHELRTPLAAVKAVIETLRGGAIEDREAADEFLEAMDQEVDRLTALVDNLLQLLRIESGALRLDLRELDLKPLLVDCAARMRPVFDRQGLHLDLELEEASAYVDPAELGRAVTNLLDNAAKFLGPGGRVKLRSCRENGRVVIEVSDDGPGIAPEDIPRLFERFYKTDRSRASAGAGLGLAIVKHIAQAHGGSVSVASKPGEGATFRIELPAKTADLTAGFTGLTGG